MKFDVLYNSILNEGVGKQEYVIRYNDPENGTTLIKYGDNVNVTSLMKRDIEHAGKRKISHGASPPPSLSVKGKEAVWYLSSIHEMSPITPRPSNKLIWVFNDDTRVILNTVNGKIDPSNIESIVWYRISFNIEGMSELFSSVFDVYQATNKDNTTTTWRNIRFEGSILLDFYVIDKNQHDINIMKNTFKDHELGDLANF